MKSYKTIISMMSGTSLDGVDACLVNIFDDLSFEIKESYSMPYSKNIRDMLFSLANNKGSVKDVCYMNFVVGEVFASAANRLMKKAGLSSSDIDFISSHGQTIYHMPDKIEIDGITTGSTLQIGDISVISYKTGIMTVGDFRTKDIAAGGQGAPLVPFADKIIFGTEKCRLIQNIGGISNVTVLSNDRDIFAFDNGPGNMLIDYCVNKLFSLPYDKDGEIAASGHIDENLLAELLKEPYYSVKPPKSTGRELFNDEYAENILKTVSCDDRAVITTLTALTAKTIADSYKNFIFPLTMPEEIILGGGGAFNKTLIGYLKEFIPGIPVKTHSDYGIPDKLKECLAFAYLGYYTLNKQPCNVASCTGAGSSVVCGKIAY